MSNLYGRLMIDIEGLSLSEEDIFVLSNKNVGGLILFLEIMSLLNNYKI